MAYDIRSIEREISNAQCELGRHLSEAEDKARQAVNWRTHYRRNPLPLLMGAAAVGVLASGVLGRHRRAPQESVFPASRSSAVPHPAIGLGLASANTALERLADAFIATASVKVAEYLEHWVPGLSKEFSRRQQ